MDQKDTILIKHFIYSIWKLLMDWGKHAMEMPSLVIDYYKFSEYMAETQTINLIKGSITIS